MLSLTLTVEERTEAAVPPILALLEADDLHLGLLLDVLSYAQTG